MNFVKGTIKSSPYVGVFCTVTEEVAITPKLIQQKEEKMLEEKLGVEVIKANIANSSLIGVLSKGLNKKIVVPEIIEKQEVKELEKEGLEIKILRGFTSTGNLIALNKNHGLASPLISDKEITELEEFFGVKFLKTRIAESDLPGACLTVTNKGLICHPNISKKEFLRITRALKVSGVPTTANYGDLFVGNSVIANTKGAIVGLNTSGIELSKIDEGLRGE